MIPKSPGDKEFFVQDWFRGCLDKLTLPYVQEGRNSYPDFWVGAGEDEIARRGRRQLRVDPSKVAAVPRLVEGYEIKSLAFANARPARKDLDFNSTIPSGRKASRDVFLVFILYTGSGSNPRRVHTISLAHADLINADHGLADEHLNIAIHLFGSFADGFIRNRKMYVFPHPVTLDPSGLGRQRLIVPREWRLADRRLRRVGTLERTVALEAVDRYTIRLHGRGDADVTRVPYENAGTVFKFDVFEAGR
jgi:hypothetical protein